MKPPSTLDMPCPVCAHPLEIPITVEQDGATLELTADAAYLEAHALTHRQHPGPGAPLAAAA